MVDFAARALLTSPDSDATRPSLGHWLEQQRFSRPFIDRLIAVADCGIVVNPVLLAGQMHGGIVHGLGNALMEDAIYDEATGQLLSGTLMDYALPRADDVPQLRVETIVTPSPNNFLGLKGVGELPTNGAPAAIANAVLDALRPLGVRHLDMPITAHKVWQALNDPN